MQAGKPLVYPRLVGIARNNWHIKEDGSYLGVRCPSCKQWQGLKLRVEGEDTWETFEVSEKGLVWPLFVCRETNKNSRYCDFAANIVLKGVG